MALHAELPDQDEVIPRTLDRETLRRLLRVTLRYRRILFVGLGLLAVSQAASLLEPRIFAWAIDEAILPKDSSLLRRFTILYAAVTCIRVITVITQAWCFESLGQRVAQALRLQVFEQILRAPVSLHDRHPAGSLLTRVTNDLSSLGEMYSAGFVSMLGNIVLMIGITIWLFLLHWKHALITLSVLPLMLLASRYFSERLKVSYREARRRLSRLNATLAENLSGMKVVHLFFRQKHQMQRYHRLNEQYAEAQMMAVRVYALFQPTITLGTGAVIALVIHWGGMDAVRGEMSPGVLSAFFSYALLLFVPLREIADRWNIFLSGMASAERVFDLLDWPQEREVAAPDTVALPSARGKIQFENVWFAYEGERWVLRDFSLTVEPGETVGIVGHTGAGKSTLIQLLLRFRDPVRGRILLDGLELGQYPLGELRRRLGLIQQDVFLFSGSFEENIHLWEAEGSRSGSRERTVRFIADFRAGGLLRQELLEEKAVNLSGGERQLIAFARAMAADPAVWILDEATASLDSGTEERLGELLQRHSRGRTVLTIAHRLATIRDCGKILVLHRGVLVESGNHRQLMEAGGIYARLYRLQQMTVELEAQSSSQTV